MGRDRDSTEINKWLRQHIKSLPPLEDDNEAAQLTATVSKRMQRIVRIIADAEGALMREVLDEALGHLFEARGLPPYQPTDLSGNKKLDEKRKQPGHQRRNTKGRGARKIPPA